MVSSWLRTRGGRAVPAVPVVVEQVHKRAGKHEQPGQGPEQVRPVFGEKEKSADRQEASKD